VGTSSGSDHLHILQAIMAVITSFAHVVLALFAIPSILWITIYVGMVSLAVFVWGIF
jgi:hypothetical protein